MKAREKSEMVSFSTVMLQNKAVHKDSGTKPEHEDRLREPFCSPIENRMKIPRLTGLFFQ